MARRKDGHGPELLAEAMRTGGVRQVQLEEAMDVARGLVSRWISRERTPGLAEATYLARRFGIPVEEWLTAADVRRIEKTARTGTDG